MEESGKEHRHEKLQKQHEQMKRHIQLHVNEHGGDLSPLLNMDTIPTEVKCIRLLSFGAKDNLDVDRCALPLPMKNQVLIRNHACGVTTFDLMERQGLMDAWVKSLKPPFVLGSELAGEVVGIGRNVTDIKLGDRVVALPERKAWAEYVVARVEHCFKIPDEMGYRTAVALTTNGILAYSLLFEIGSICENKSVLLHSAPGGLDNMIEQMILSVPNAKLFKIAPNLNEETDEMDKAVYCIDSDADYASQIRHVSPQGVDVVLDCQYENNFSRDFGLLKPMGKYILFGTQAAGRQGLGFFEAAKAWWGKEKLSPLKLYEDNKSISGFNLRHLLYFHRDRQFIRNVVDKVFDMWKKGTIRPVVHSVLHFEDYNEAFYMMQEYEQMGKIVFDPVMHLETGGQSGQIVSNVCQQTHEFVPRQEAKPAVELSHEQVGYVPRAEKESYQHESKIAAQRAQEEGQETGQQTGQQTTETEEERKEKGIIDKLLSLHVRNE